MSSRIRISTSKPNKIVLVSARFVLIDDGSGKPLSGVNLLIEYPDGSRREHSTDSQGQVTLSGPSMATFRVIEIRAPGVCVVSQVT